MVIHGQVLLYAMAYSVYLLPSSIVVSIILFFNRNQYFCLCICFVFVLPRCPNLCPSLITFRCSASSSTIILSLNINHSTTDNSFSRVEMALHLCLFCAFPNQPLLFFVQSFAFSDLCVFLPGFVQQPQHAHCLRHKSTNEVNWSAASI